MSRTRDLEFLTEELEKHADENHGHRVYPYMHSLYITLAPYINLRELRRGEFENDGGAE